MFYFLYVNWQPFCMENHTSLPPFSDRMLLFSIFSVHMTLICSWLEKSSTAESKRKHAFVPLLKKCHKAVRKYWNAKLLSCVTYLVFGQRFSDFISLWPLECFWYGAQTHVSWKFNRNKWYSNLVLSVFHSLMETRWQAHWNRLSCPFSSVIIYMKRTTHFFYCKEGRLRAKEKKAWNRCSEAFCLPKKSVSCTSGSMHTSVWEPTVSNVVIFTVYHYIHTVSANESGMTWCRLNPYRMVGGNSHSGRERRSGGIPVIHCPAKICTSPHHISAMLQLRDF